MQTDERDFLYTTPANALKTAAYLRRHGYRRPGYFRDSLFIDDIQYQRARRVAAWLTKVAELARERKSMVAFRSETGGAGSGGWRPYPVLWRRP